jgi:hypothetical protein
MLHNFLYRLQREQKKALLVLGLSFLVLSFVWFVAELNHWSFPMEPLVVLNGGLATLFASYWPWKPQYADRRLRCRVSLDYKSNNGTFKIGREELEFTLKFSEASGESIHVYNDPSDIKVIAIAHGAGQISDIRDASVFDFTSRTVTPNEGQIICLENQNGNFACVQIIDVKSENRGDFRNEVTVAYVINPASGTDFS